MTELMQPWPSAPAAKAGRWPVMLLVVMFMPGHMFDWAVEWAWLLAVALIGVCQLFFPGTRPPALFLYRERSWMRFGMVLTILTAAGAAYAAMRFGIMVGMRDYVDFPRYLVYGMIGIMIARSMAVTDPVLIDRSLRGLILFNLGCAAAILLSVPVLREALLLIYDGAKLQYDSGYVRIGIPFPNPNFAAMVFMFCLGYFTFFRPSLWFALFSLIAIVVTGSRSGLLAAVPILVLGYLMVLVQFARSRNWKVGLALLTSHALLIYFSGNIVAAIEGLNRLQEVVEALQSGGIGNVNTARIRNEISGAMFDNFVLRSPLVGWGPGKSIGIDVADSQYMSWVLLFGFLGTAVVAAFYLGMFLPMLRTRAPARYLLGCAAVGASFAIILYTGDFMKNYRMFYMAVFFLHLMLYVMHGQALARPATLPPAQRKDAGLDERAAGG